MKMPKVGSCKATECCYNEESICHALAITIGGDGEYPECDTYCSKSSKGGDQSATAGVGACKVDTCQYNEHFECVASQITIGKAHDPADCLTFAQG